MIYQTEKNGEVSDKGRQEIKDWVVGYAVKGLEITDCNKFEIKDSRIEFCKDCGIDFSGNMIETKDCSLSNNRVGLKALAQEFTVKNFVLTDNRTGMMVIGGEGTIKKNEIVSNDTGLVIVEMNGDVKENFIKGNGIGIYITGEQGKRRVNKGEEGMVRVSENQGIRGKDIRISGDQDKCKGLRIGKKNVFDHNLMFHIYNNTPDSIDATKNYWYPSEPESIAFYIYDYYDDPDLGIVYFEPTAGKFGGGPQGAEMPKQVRHDITVNFGSNPAGCISIKYIITEEEKVDIAVYDVSGRLIVKENSLKKPGRYDFVIDNLPDGVYFVKLDCEGIEVKRKVILLD